MAWINHRELAATIHATSPPQAGIQDGAIDVEIARLGAALPIATFVTRQALDDRRGTGATKANIRDTGIVVLTAAVAMVLTRRNAKSAGTDFSLVTFALAPLLSGGIAPEPAQSEDRD